MHLFLRAETPAALPLPCFLSAVQAGFPSPADSYIEGALDLNDHLVRHPAATFLVRVAGDSMTGAGIHDGDLLVVDRSLEPKSGSIVIASVDGELTVKRLVTRDGTVTLIPENPDYPPLPVTSEHSLAIWGVVQSVIHRF